MDYKEKLEEAKRLYELANDDQKDVLESLFPELKESEDEMIRKGIIHNLKYLANKAQGFVKDELEERIAWLEKQVPVDEEKVLIGVRKDIALSIMNFFDKNTLGMGLSNMEFEDLEEAVVNSDWLKVYRYMKKKLEKQDEQKQDPCEHCDNVMLNCQNFPCIKKRAFEQGKSILEVINEEKVEPKFKVGDWVVSPNGVYWHIDRIENNRYEVTSDTGKCADWPLDTDLYHLWTIKDAKDGDVLATEDKNFTTPFVAIYKGLRGSLTFNSHCFIGFNGNFYEGEGGHAIEGIHPATKEQREQLEKAMADAGYTFDFEKKELKKISQRTISAEAKEAMYGKPTAWSEEDENILEAITYTVKNSGYSHCIGVSIKVMIDWLNSLKQRINND